MILFFGSMVLSSTARSESTLNKILRKIDSLEKKISKNHNVSFVIPGYSFDAFQKTEVKNCFLKIHTNHLQLGNIFKDQYDLKKVRPIRKKLLYFKTHGIHFGVKSWMKERSGLYFNNKIGRQKVFNTLKKIHYLCRNRRVKNHFNKNIKSKSRLTTEYDSYMVKPRTETENEIISNQGMIASLEGRNSFIQRYKSALNAKDLIYIQKLVFRGDIAGRFFSEILIKKYQEGVDVKIIVDALASGLMNYVQAPEDKPNTYIMLNNLMAGGIKVFGYSCNKSLRSEVYGVDLGKIIRRNHEKYWITDSSAIIGGINLGQEYFSLTGKSIRSWRDHDMAVTGPVVDNIKNMFKRNWLTNAIRYKSWKSDKKCLNPHHPKKEKAKYLRFLKEKTQKYKSYKKEEDLEFEKTIRENIQNYISNKNPFGENFLFNKILFRPIEKIRFISARPEEGENTTHQAYIDLINRAERTIDVGMALQVSPVDFRDAIKRALERGVRVRMYARGKKTVGGPPIMQVLNGSYYHELMLASDKFSGSIEFFEWTGKKNGGEIQFGSVHTKYMVVDDRAVIIGSHNLNQSSKKNTESVLAFEGDEIGRDLASQFNFDLEFCRKVELIEAKLNHRPIKIKDRILLRLLKLIEDFV